jgi:hypothetical protein
VIVIATAIVDIAEVDITSKVNTPIPNDNRRLASSTGIPRYQTKALKSKNLSTQCHKKI